MTTDQLSRTFAALADPTRRAMLARLSQGEATVGQLAEPFALTFAAISKHLGVLETAGLVSRGRDAKYRPARLEATPLQPHPRGSATMSSSGKTASAPSTATSPAYRKENNHD